MGRRRFGKLVLAFVLATGFVLGTEKAFAETEIRYDGSSQIYWAFVKDSADMFTQETGIKISAEDRTTQDAVPSLVFGRSNVAGLARKMKLAEKAQGKDLVETLIAKDHLAVFVPSNSKLENISGESLKKVFAGQIKDWKEIGDEHGPIVVVIPQANTACQKNFRELVMGDTPFVASAAITPTAGAVLEEAKGKRALSFISYGAVSRRPEFKILKVDGKYPGDQTYALGQDLYLVTEGPPTGIFKKYIDFFLTGNGREVILKAGLLPAL
ncbi:MAG: substrate-binding domain-containing protein [Syntrophobacteraceae bacterium]|nr:substrate-binding domain-containing protein [Desulfobacteraceae bacterium]